MHGVTEVLLYVGGPSLLALFVVQYIVLRIRDTRATPPDPHLGRKALLYLFVNVGCFLVLSGLTISAVDLVTYFFTPMAAAQQARKNAPPADPNAPSTPVPTAAPLPARDWFNDAQRSAAGLVTSGLLYGLLFWLIVRVATNDRQFPTVGRAFAGTRLMVAAVIVVTLGTCAILQAFERGETDIDAMALEIGIAIVWGPTAILHLLLLLRTSRGESF